MRAYLLTIEEAYGQASHIQILPRVPLHGLNPKLLVPRSGETLELCLPDGQIKHATISSFGIEAWRGSDGTLYTNSDPESPTLSLFITGDLLPDEIPPGTEIWLSEAKFRTDGNST